MTWVNFMIYKICHNKVEKHHLYSQKVKEDFEKFKQEQNDIHAKNKIQKTK